MNLWSIVEQNEEHPKVKHDDIDQQEASRRWIRAQKHSQSNAAQKKMLVNDRLLDYQLTTHLNASN